MKSTAILFLAFSWAAAFAVAVKNGLSSKLLRLRNADARASGYRGTYSLLLPTRSADS